MYEPKVNCIGMKFGRLEIIEHLTERKVIAKCDCGKIKTCQMYQLEAGSVSSCGCYLREATSIRMKQLPKKFGEDHPMYSHGHFLNRKASHTYISWQSLRSRCTNVKSNRFDAYGGKGVTVCDRWKDSFENFLADMGERPVNTTIDRIDNSKGYEPGNCRWATKSEQAINRKTTMFVTYNGETACLKETAKKYGMRYVTVFKRLKRGWTLEDALTKPYKITKQNKHL